jgi:anion-transporting  ArsA/GET3 family ATPase
MVATRSRPSARPARTAAAAAAAFVPGIRGKCRLHVVTGKGGTGKTTVAAALALALADTGRKVLLVEVESRQAIAQLFDIPPMPYSEQRLASCRSGGQLFGLAIDPEQAMIEYLELFYGLKRSARSLRKIGAVDFVTTLAPGLRDVLLTGKVKEATVRSDQSGNPVYDAVVLDAPPTGRIARFLNATNEVAKLTKFGPINRQSEGVIALLHGPRTSVHLVTLLEEMPVQETVDGVGELTAVDLPVGAVLVNMVREPLMPPEALAAAEAGQLDLGEIAAGVKRAGIDVDEATVAALADEAREHAGRVALEGREREVLAGLGRPMVELPLIAEGAADLAGLYELAERLGDQGLA